MNRVNLMSELKRTKKIFLTHGDIDSNKKRSLVERLSKKLKVFISYSNEDKQVASKIKAILADFDIESFMAHEDIFISEEWRNRILEELNQTDVFIPILSDNFKNSDWCSQESGIACSRNILIIPLCLDRTKPFGFMSQRQGKQIDDDKIPLHYIMKPIADNFPKINILKTLMERLTECNSYRDCENAMEDIVPYFNKLNSHEINKIVDISIENNQIWPANLCYQEYLPKFIEINHAKINPTKLNKLLELIGENL